MKKMFERVVDFVVPSIMAYSKRPPYDRIWIPDLGDLVIKVILGDKNS